MKKISSFTYAIVFAISVNAVGLSSGEGNANSFPASLNEDSFTPSSLLLSGATDKGDSKYKIESKGGIGWYWDGGVDGSKVQDIHVEFGAATPKYLYLQIHYGDNQVLRKKISAQKTSYTLTLGADSKYSHVTSVSLLSMTSQTVNLKRIYATDVQGHVITYVDLVTCQQEVVSTIYYNIVGKRIPRLAKGVNIVRYRMSDGSVKTRKVMIP